jgi:formate hydrogenlyase transcriptional activator
MAGLADNSAAVPSGRQELRRPEVWRGFVARATETSMSFDVHGTYDSPPVAERSQALLDVAESITSCCAPEELFGRLATELQRVVPFEFLGLVVLKPERDVPTLRFLETTSDILTSHAEWRVDVHDDPSAWVIEKQEALVVPDAAAETRWGPAMTEFRELGVASFCVLPLTTACRRLGALALGRRNETRYSSADIAFLRDVAKVVAVAVDNALNFEQTKTLQARFASERDRLRLLLDVTNAMVSNLDPRALFSVVAKCVRRVVAHDYTSLGVYDAGRNAFEMSALEFAGKGLIKEHMLVPVEGSPAGRAFTTGAPARYERAGLTALGSEIAGLLLAEGIQSICSVPLIVHDRRLGTLTAGRLDGRAFTDEEAELLSSVASQVAIAVENALAFREIAELKDKLAEECLYLERELRTERAFEEIVGDSRALRETLQQVEIVAPTEATVLVLGETGTGKELVARGIHDRSSRRDRTFVKINCAAIPSGLLESELFGHERGAFTGAIAQKIGRFEVANGGTLFLDEVGEIPLELQPKLLRVLQEQEFERLGGTRTIKVDVRLIAATNRDLARMVEEQRFRDDLYYRLNVFPVHIPPLRDRPEDIPSLVRFFVQRLARPMNRHVEVIPNETLEALRRYPWPGNVRELANLVERAMILSHGRTLEVPLAELQRRPSRIASDDGAAGTLEGVERAHVQRILEETNWVLSGARGAAARLGMKRTTLQSLMKRLGVAKPV